MLRCCLSGDAGTLCVLGCLSKMGGQQDVWQLYSERARGVSMSEVQREDSNADRGLDQALSGLLAVRLQDEGQMKG